jgi:Carboxypeptidase regulatory-like domain
MPRYPMPSAICGMAAITLGLAACARYPVPGSLRPHPCLAVLTSTLHPRSTYDSVALPGRILGFAYTPDAAPVQGMQASIERADGSILRGAISDSTGRFEVDSVPPGIHELKIRLIGFRSSSLEAYVHPGSTDTVCAIMRPYWLDLPIRVGQRGPIDFSDQRSYSS